MQSLRMPLHNPCVDPHTPSSTMDNAWASAHHLDDVVYHLTPLQLAISLLSWNVGTNAMSKTTSEARLNARRTSEPDLDHPSDRGDTASMRSASVDKAAISKPPCSSWSSTPSHHPTRQFTSTGPETATSFIERQAVRCLGVNFMHLARRPRLLHQLSVDQMHRLLGSCFIQVSGVYCEGSNKSTSPSSDMRANVIACLW